MKILYLSGLSLQEIGDSYGLSRERIRQILEVYKIDGREVEKKNNLRKRKIIADKAKIILKNEPGITNLELAQRLGKKQFVSISRILSEAGINRPASPPPSRLKVNMPYDLLKRLYILEDRPQTEIAKITGHSQSFISVALKKAGLSKNR